MEKPVYTLGYNQNHDAAAALCRDGIIVSAIAQERLSRRKHDMSDVAAAVEYVLAAEGITPSDLTAVIACDHGRPAAGWADGEAGLHAQLARRSERLVVYNSHHELHAYSALYTSPFGDAAVLVADGMGSRLANMSGRDTSGGIDNEFGPSALAYLNYSEAESLFTSTGGTKLLPLLRRYTTRNPYDFDNEDISLGRLYSYASKHIFETRFDAGKTMALAAFGDASALPSFLDIDGDSVRVNRARLRVFGEKPKDPSPMAHADLAARVQLDLEIALLARARYLRRNSDHSALCVVGGVGLNCTANRRLAMESGFDEIYCMPAATDDGIAIGAALFGYHNELGLPRTSPHGFNPYLGKIATDAELSAAVDRAVQQLGHRLKVTRHASGDGSLFATVKDLLLDMQVIAWYQDGAEFGPRALGNRSILASPSTEQMRDHINLNIKGRELFRPLAPVVLAAECRRYFDVEDSFASPWMMFNVRVRDGARSAIPAVVHIDGTARVQTIDDECNPRLNTLLEHISRSGHPPVLLNTSLNGPGEAIVETAEEAVDLFLTTPIDCLVLGDWVLEKSEPDSRRRTGGATALREGPTIGT